LFFVHRQVPSLAPVREIEATPKTEDEDEFEYDYRNDCEKGGHPRERGSRPYRSCQSLPLLPLENRRALRQSSQIVIQILSLEICDQCRFRQRNFPA
jgi:hypothetical protein